MSRVSDKPYFVYVLWSAVHSRFYIGINEDVEARLLQHNTGVSTWTAKYMPWSLVHVESYASYSAARKRELLLKKQKGGAGFFTLSGLDRLRFRKMAAQSGS